MLRVVHCGTGNVGRFAVRGLVDRPDLKLVGLYSVSPDKIGKDAGELVGCDPTGVTATDDLGALLDLKPDCVSYFAMGHNRIAEATDDVVKILERGIDVVATSHVELVAGVHSREDAGPIYERVAAACETGKSTFFVNGVHPGFASDALPLLLASVCSRIDAIRIQEIAVYDHYIEADGDLTNRKLFGLGMPPDFQPLMFFPGDGVKLYFGPMIRQIANQLGHPVDDFTITHENWVTPKDLNTSMGLIKAGEVAAIHWELHGMVNGVPRVTIEHYTRVQEDTAPDWPKLPPADNANEDRFRVIVTGEPTASLIFDAGAENFGRNREEGGHVVAAARTINAIPAVVAAAPGILTPPDLPFYACTNLPW